MSKGIRPNSIPSNVGPIRPMMLIIMALFILVGMGMITNSLSNSGLMNLNNPTPAYTCTINNYLNCPIPIETSCAQNSQNCQVGGATGVDSIFNPSSPFTPLVEGNIGALFTQLRGTSNVQAFQGPFDPLGGGTYYNAVCTVYPSISGHLGLGDWNMTGCTQTIEGENSNYTSSTADNITNYNPVGANATYNLAMYQLYSYNMPYPQDQFQFNTTTMLVGCDWEGTYNFTTSGSGSSETSTGYTWYGCGVGMNGWLSPPSAPKFAFMIGIDNSVGKISNSYNHIAAFIQPEQWDTTGCLGYYSDPSAFAFAASQQCLTFENTINPKTSSDFGPISYLIGLAVGVALFLLGLNLTVQGGGSILGTGTNLMVGTGPQGARLAQSLGISLIVWIPMFSEFSGWLTSPLLGSTGLEVLLLFFVTGMFFVGAFWQALSFD